MARKTLIRSDSYPYHVTARVNNKELFPCDLDFVWDVFSTNLNHINSGFSVKVHAFVLMPNHFHLLLTTPGDDLGVVMKWFMAAITKTINTYSGRTGRVFGARYHWSLIQDMNYFDTALKYVYRNPVKAGIVDRAEDFAYSTLGHALGRSKSEFLVEPPAGIRSLLPADDSLAFSNWINQPFKYELDERIRIGMRRTRFSLLPLAR